MLEDFDRHQFVTDCQTFDRVQNFVRHQVAFVCLILARRTQFGSWLLIVNRFERRQPFHTKRTGLLHPDKPLSQIVFVDSSNRTDSA